MSDFREWQAWTDEQLEEMLLGGAEPGSPAHEAAKFILDKRHRERERQSTGRRDPADQATQSVDFSFIANAKLRSIAERDWDECQRAFRSKCWKSVLILAGGLVETVLLSTLTRRRKRVLKTKAASGASGDPTRWDLDRLIKAALELNLVPPLVQTFPDPLRKYRNLAHPGNEVREKLKFGEPEVTTAYHALRTILSHVSGSSIPDVSDHLAESATESIAAGWEGVEWKGNFLAYDGPHDGLDSKEDRPFEMSMQDALKAGGYNIALYDRGNFRHVGDRVHFVLLTDRRTWKCRIARGNDEYLVASPTSPW